MEWLRKLLEGAKKKEDGSIDIDDLMKQVNTEFPKNAVPKSTYNDVSEQLKTANATITDLKKNNVDNEALQQTINDREATIKQMEKDHKAEIIKLGRESINNELLLKYKAKNNKAVMALLGEIEASDNETYKTLLDSRLKDMSEADDTRFMFGDLKVETRYNPVAGNGDTTVTKEQFQKMGYTERVALYNENKELYTKLSNE